MRGIEELFQHPWLLIFYGHPTNLRVFVIRHLIYNLNLVVCFVSSVFAISNVESTIYNDESSLVVGV